MEDLINFLKKGNFQIKKYKNRLDYLKQSSERLLHLGIVKIGFQEALIERETNYPTGLKTKTLSISIPHADSEYVEREMIDVTLFEEPLSFQRMDNPQESVEAKIAFMLLFKEPHTHIMVLKDLSQLLQTEEFEKIKKIRSQEELILFLREIKKC